MSSTILNRAQKKIEEDEDSTPLINLWRMERLLNQMQTIGWNPMSDEVFGKIWDNMSVDKSFIAHIMNTLNVSWSDTD